ncbi:MAG TPA: Tim44-like domain-containing protein [Burkholderiaceae bacterium]|nr:Tim44-like domain-containing protein [Burkholderiaceae bacterium]
MKRLITLVLIGVLAATVAVDADAQRRLGGGRNLGKQSPQVQQRQATPQQQTPTQEATPAQPAAAGAAAAAPRASSPWKGALLGIAAGLGIAALASYLGFGETLTAILMAAVIGFAVVALIGFVLRRMRGGTVQPAYGGAGARAGGGGMYAPEAQPAPLPAPAQRSNLDLGAGARPGSAMDEFARGSPTAAAAQPWGVPGGFDTEGFLGHAKDYFRKLQSAWDRGSLAELEEFTTHDMFVALTHELRARGAATRTEVLTLEAALLGIESTPTEHLASVRFSGSLRVDGEIEQVDEVWNLSKPVDGSAGWLLAGIQQLS